MSTVHITKADKQKLIYICKNKHYSNFTITLQKRYNKIHKLVKQKTKIPIDVCDIINSYIDDIINIKFVKYIFIVFDILFLYII